MRNWKCRECKRYIPVSINTIEINDIVVFQISHPAKKIKHKITIKARVLNKDNIFLFLVSGRDFYLVDYRDVYPPNAPVFFVYNMFGICDC
ncbi:hypothetical protein [Acinetobacter sp. neg1]|uniref:hypothetical protein n=1 Tax=Acinetobacter sp. neg1 TaxID=1561068 RepID=UPI0006473566|nr:hypothetical protein [Acinetobacter sp. neg1]